MINKNQRKISKFFILNLIEIEKKGREITQGKKTTISNLISIKNYINKSFNNDKKRIFITDLINETQVEPFFQKILQVCDQFKALAFENGQAELINPYFYLLKAKVYSQLMQLCQAMQCFNEMPRLDTRTNIYSYTCKKYQKFQWLLCSLSLGRLPNGKQISELNNREIIKLKLFYPYSPIQDYGKKIEEILDKIYERAQRDERVKQIMEFLAIQCLDNKRCKILFFEGKNPDNNLLGGSFNNANSIKIYDLSEMTTEGIVKMFIHEAMHFVMNRVFGEDGNSFYPEDKESIKAFNAAYRAFVSQPANIVSIVGGYKFGVPSGHYTGVPLNIPDSHLTNSSLIYHVLDFDVFFPMTTHLDPDNHDAITPYKANERNAEVIARTIENDSPALFPLLKYYDQYVKLKVQQFIDNHARGRNTIYIKGGTYTPPSLEAFESFTPQKMLSDLFKDLRKINIVVKKGQMLVSYSIIRLLFERAANNEASFNLNVNLLEELIENPDTRVCGDFIFLGLEMLEQFTNHQSLIDKIFSTTVQLINNDEYEHKNFLISIIALKALYNNKAIDHQLLHHVSKECRPALSKMKINHSKETVADLFLAFDTEKGSLKVDPASNPTVYHQLAGFMFKSYEIRKLLEDHPNDTQALFLLAIVYLGLDNYFSAFKKSILKNLIYKWQKDLHFRHGIYLSLLSQKGIVLRRFYKFQEITKWINNLQLFKTDQNGNLALHLGNLEKFKEAIISNPSKCQAISIIEMFKKFPKKTLNPDRHLKLSRAYTEFMDSIAYKLRMKNFSAEICMAMYEVNTMVKLIGEVKLFRMDEDHKFCANFSNIEKVKKEILKHTSLDSALRITESLIKGSEKIKIKYEISDEDFAPYFESIKAIKLHVLAKFNNEK